MRSPWLGAVAVACLWSCSSDPPSPPPAADARPTTPTLTVEARRARYDARPTIEPPADVPTRWAELPRGLEGRLTRVEHEVHARTDDAPPYRRIQMELRVFGTDAGVEARLLSALSALELPGLSAGLPEGPVTEGAVTWRLTVRRFRAPPGEAREAIATLDWRHVPPDPPDPPRCKKPKPVTAPPEAPKWLRARTLRMTTRQRVSATVTRDPEGVRVTMHVLFRNGETQDGDVASLVKLAERRKMTREREAGLEQRWVGSKDTLSWRPDNRPLHLGCRIVGPVIELSWAER